MHDNRQLMKLVSLVQEMLHTLEPSAVERLGALVDPELAEKVADYNERTSLYAGFTHMGECPMISNVLG